MSEPITIGSQESGLGWVTNGIVIGGIKEGRQVYLRIADPCSSRSAFAVLEPADVRELIENLKALIANVGLVMMYEEGGEPTQPQQT